MQQRIANIISRLLPQQAAKLLPEQPPPSTDPEAATAAKKLLATRLGHFLRTCPGLNKTTIGELLGDPDPFYLEVGSGNRVALRKAGVAEADAVLTTVPGSSSITNTTCFSR